MTALLSAHTSGGGCFSSQCSPRPSAFWLVGLTPKWPVWKAFWVINLAQRAPAYLNLFAFPYSAADATWKTRRKRKGEKSPKDISVRGSSALCRTVLCAATCSHRQRRGHENWADHPRRPGPEVSLSLLGYGQSWLKSEICRRHLVFRLPCERKQA